MQVLKGVPAQILTVFLLLQAGAYYAVASRQESIPQTRPLAEFPHASNGWTMERDFPVEKEVQEVLRADDTLNRVYVSPQHQVASLFIAFFKTQRYGQAPHSPKNCLPGAGWQPMDDSKVSIEVPGREKPIVVNKYVISRGDQRSVVLYWYQSHSRVIAGEFAAKFWLVADSVSYRRSDTALVRVIVPAQNETASAEQTAIEFARAAYPDIARQLPN